MKSICCEKRSGLRAPVSSFSAKKLDTPAGETDTAGVPQQRPNSISEQVRRRVLNGGERLWRPSEFGEFSFAAVAQALSRLEREGVLQRLSKGVYYRSRETVLGKSRPNPTKIKELANGRTMYASGSAAAALLGFTTQILKRGHLATSGMSLPRKLVGEDTIIHTRRPQAWTHLSEQDAAVLEFLRSRGRYSELPPRETVRRLIAIISEGDRFERLLAVADHEPPRVRAMIGAVGQEIEKNAEALAHLRSTLNPYSTFEFGMFAGLKHARDWRAKDAKP